MRETAPFVNSVGSQYVAERARNELVCDSFRSQGEALRACIGLCEGIVHPAAECNQHIVKSLLKDVTGTWSTMVHHQSGHLTKQASCHVCMEDAGSRVAHKRQREIDNQGSCIVI